MKTKTHASLTEQAYRVLVQRIVTLDLPPGSVLTESRLIEELGIGRTPIREALQRLIAEGLVTHLHHRGMLVADILAAEVQEIYEFRARVEGFAARLAAARMTAGEIEEIQRIHVAMDLAMADMDPDSFLAQDRRFHEVLAHGARNRYVERVLLRIYNLHLRLWYFLFKKQGGLKETVHQHQEIIEAVAQRNGDEAEAAMRRYVMRLASQIKDVI